MDHAGLQWRLERYDKGDYGGTGMAGGVAKYRWHDKQGHPSKFVVRTNAGLYGEAVPRSIVLDPQETVARVGLESTTETQIAPKHFWKRTATAGIPNVP
jgi:hypothetical protein